MRNALVVFTVPAAWEKRYLGMPIQAILADNVENPADFEIIAENIEVMTMAELNEINSRNS